MIDLRRLRAFSMIADEGHITRAAARLGMQQPPLTRLLQGLEAELGVKLMQRTPRGVRPTAAGGALLEEARAILARADGLAEVVRRAARGETGRLAIGFTGSAALHPFVPAALRAFREALPAVALTLEEAGTGELVDALLQERLDAAFVRTPIRGLPGLAIDDVLEEAMIVALPAGHLLATEARTSVRLSRLAEEPFILYRRPTGPGLHDAIVAACRGAGFSPNVVQEAPRLTATLSLVAAGLGLSIVPASMRSLNIDGVAYKALSGPSALIAPIHLATRREDPSAVLARLRDLVGKMRTSHDAGRSSPKPSSFPRETMARPRPIGG
ncbi:DNA-binding transcriptional regulator, LysR family [Rhizobiales bacterium GAS191]|nr:DNA-binding transcriptional regulator, LysR family [Rhizobiales bacterium GAS113]SEC40251.1 DNA-binding transcriptional regulator, LysR family [Rhizobiales bacterium GAS191]SEC85650.1 DNA-binding transcriptional regulator, LysR family [Rhizobiales bacterium GAS188]